MEMRAQAIRKAFSEYKKSEPEVIVIPPKYSEDKLQLKEMLDELKELKKQKYMKEIEELKQARQSQIEGEQRRQQAGSILDKFLNIGSAVLPQLVNRYAQLHDTCNQRTDCVIQQYVRGYSVQGYYRQVRGRLE